MIKGPQLIRAGSSAAAELIVKNPSRFSSSTRGPGKMTIHATHSNDPGAGAARRRGAKPRQFSYPPSRALSFALMPSSTLGFSTHPLFYALFFTLFFLLFFCSLPVFTTIARFLIEKKSSSRLN